MRRLPCSRRDSCPEGINELRARVKELEKARDKWQAETNRRANTENALRAKLAEVEKERDEARTQAVVEHTENDRLRATIEPVREWYDGDGERTDVAAMFADAVEDLQRDRADALKVKPLRAKLKEVERERDHANMVTAAAAEKIKELESHRAPSPGAAGTIRDKNALIEYKDAQIAKLQDRVKELEVVKSDRKRRSRNSPGADSEGR